MSLVTPGLVLRRKIDRFGSHVKVSAEAADLIDFVRETKTGLRVWMMRKSLRGRAAAAGKAENGLTEESVYTGSGTQRPYVEDRTKDTPSSDQARSSDQTRSTDSTDQTHEGK